MSTTTQTLLELDTTSLPNDSSLPLTAGAGAPTSPFNYAFFESDKQTVRTVPMKVIVCGLMRTGTSSMQAALRMLGYNDVYHMQTLALKPSDSKFWSHAIDCKYHGKGTMDRHDWDQMLGTSQAICDTPASLFGVELAQAYPEAKVVILNREFEPWYKSCLSTIGELRDTVNFKTLTAFALDFPTMGQYVFFLGKMQLQACKFDWPEKEKAESFFHSYYQNCRDEIPEKRRLEYRVQDGWGPLCKHLGVPVPKMKNEEGVWVEVPFPRVNDSKEFTETYGKQFEASRWRAARNAGVIVAGIAAAVYYML